MRWLAIGLILLFLPVQAEAAMSQAAKHRMVKVNRRIARLPEDQKLALAQAFVDRNWSRTSRFFGAQGQPSPTLSFGTESGGTGGVVRGPDGNRQMQVAPYDLNPMIYRSRNRTGKRGARRQVIHEEAHIYQRPELLATADPNQPHDDRPVEAGAIGFADGVMQRLSRKDTIRRMARHDNPRLRRMKQRYRANSLSPLDTTQFGSNYGANPRTIPWPSS